jgi:low affinity Fe/Cu permease
MPGRGDEARATEAQDRVRDRFQKLAYQTATAVGSPWAFLLALVGTVAWALSGPRFHYSDTWQLVINTGTSIGTFLIVFLIQATQNRDAKVMHLKLDELIRALREARTSLVQMEDLPDDELKRLQEEFQSLRDRAASDLEQIELSKKKRSNLA